MASYEADGLVLPIRLGGHPALDFCNTRAGWGEPAPKEYLASYAHLAVWARENGLLDPAAVTRLVRAGHRTGPDAVRVLARAIRFRGALYRVLTGAAAPRDWAAVTAELRAAAPYLRLVPAQPPGPVARRRVAGADLPLPLAAIAASAADLVTAATSATVAACPGRGCGWLFADARGRRRWCSMAMCGNRAKARRHSDRVRQRAGGH